MLELLIAGDFCPIYRLKEVIDSNKYSDIFYSVNKEISKVDFSIVNLEAPVVDTNVSPIEKCGPNLKCSSKAIGALKYAGFNLVTLANNHIYDYGDEGVIQTINACKKGSIDYVGAGMKISEASKIFFKKINGITIAIINCCEHEFSIATETSAGSNPLNPIQQYYAIQEAKQKADKIIVIIHGGYEHYQLPTPRMKETYRFLVDAGADAVINHHQHCYSGYEIYNKKPIVYGLGNFCFDWDGKRKSIWNEGYLLKLLFNNDSINISLIPYIQCNNEATISIIKDADSLNAFTKKIKELNSIINDDKLLMNYYLDFLESTKLNYSILFEPYNNKYLKALYRRGLLPSFLTKKKKLQLLNYMNCESHIDRLINSIK